MSARFENLACPQLGAAFASLTAFEPMGDSQRGRIRLGMKGRAAHERRFRIYLESDGEQCQHNHDENGSHGPRLSDPNTAEYRRPDSEKPRRCGFGLRAVMVPVDRRQRRAGPALLAPVAQLPPQAGFAI